MDKLVEKMKSKLSGVEGFWSKLPAVRDYKEKELRREADKRVRLLLSDSLSKIRNEISGLQVELLNSAGGLTQMERFEQAIGQLQLLIDRVKTTTYGYAPLFDADKIREVELDKLIRFDRALAAKVPGLAKKVNALQQAIRDGGNVQSSIKAVSEAIGQLNDLFLQRKQAIEGEDVPAPELPEMPTPAEEIPAAESETQPLPPAIDAGKEDAPAGDTDAASVAEPAAPAASASDPLAAAKASDPLAEASPSSSSGGESAPSAADLLADLGNDPLGDDSKASNDVAAKH